MTPMRRAGIAFGLALAWAFVSWTVTGSCGVAGEHVLEEKDR